MTAPALKDEDLEFVVPQLSPVWQACLVQSLRGAVAGVFLGPFTTTLYSAKLVEPADAIMVGLILGLPVGALVGGVSGAFFPQRARQRGRRLPAVVASGVSFLLLLRVLGDPGYAVLACIVAPALWMLATAVARFAGWGIRGLLQTARTRNSRKESRRWFE